MLLKKITDGIYTVRAENEGRFPYSFSFLLRGDRNILLDAGAGINSLDKLRREVEIDLVIISHTHGDHISSLSVIKDIPCVVPEMQWESVLDIDRLGRRFVRDDEAAFRVWKHFMVSTLGVMSFTPHGTYGEGDTFSTGRHDLVALHTPGHTADHFCLFEERTGTLFSFDIDLTSFGPWYGHEESDIESFISSIRRARDISPEVLVSSHVPPVHAAIKEHLDDYEEKIYRREENIRALVTRGFSIGEMVAESPIYGGHPHIPELLSYFEKVMIKKHLDRLEQTSRK